MAKEKKSAESWIEWPEDCLGELLEELKTATKEISEQTEKIRVSTRRMNSCGIRLPRMTNE